MKLLLSLLLAVMFVQRLTAFRSCAFVATTTSNSRCTARQTLDRLPPQNSRLMSSSKRPPAVPLTQLLAQLQQAQKEEKDPGEVKGTNLRIVKYPHPALRAENEPVAETELKDKEKLAELTQLSKEMLSIMYAAEGVGLAAPQVGVNKRLMVYNPTGDSTKWLNEVVLVNPQIVATSEATDVETEGCLSFPDMNGKVERNKWIKVEGQTLKGRTIKKKFTGWEARIFQHEYDHLDGVVYIDRLVNDEERGNVKQRLDELIAEHGPGGAL